MVSGPGEDLLAPSPNSTISRIQLDMIHHLTATWTGTFVTPLTLHTGYEGVSTCKVLRIVPLVKTKASKQQVDVATMRQV